jgi:ABC-type multidrug transport system ATPase subunit
VPPAELVFAGIRRRFGRLRVLDGVAGEVGAGGVLVVRGPNGCGKSTLLRCLAGLLRPDRGEIRAVEAGRELGLEERRRRVGYLAPDVAFYDELSGGENLEFLARLRGVAAARGEELAARLGLAAERAHRAMSSGMRQRLRWAFALLHDPSILLLDEPFQNLDPEGERAARELLAERLAAGALAVVATPAALELDGVTGELRLHG